MENIGSFLDSLEKDYQIKILFCSEAGSRAWGFHGPNSDYDLRFVFLHVRKETYLKLKGFTKYLSGKTDNYDWQGWDLTKALLLLKDSNPSLIEWLYSPIIYLNRQIETTDNQRIDFKTETKKCMPNRSTLLHHYASCAKASYFEAIEKNMLTAKSYLLSMRMACMFMWIVNNDISNLSVDLIQVLSDLKPEIGSECYDNIVRLILLKRGGYTDLVQRVKCLDDLLDKVFKTPIEKNKINYFSDDYYDKLFLAFLNFGI